MQAQVTMSKGLERRLEVAIPGEQVAGEVDQRLKQIARTARLKGFRPGKVPYAVVRQQYGSEVHAEAVRDLMQRSFAEAVTQHKLRPAGGPRLEPIAMEPGRELRYAAVFEVLPEIALKPLDGIAVERPTATVSDEDVGAMLESMRAQRPSFNPVERPAAEGDRVSINYEGRIDGEIFPGGKGDGLAVTLGAHRILTELEQALYGMKVDEHKSVAARFPDDYGAKSVAGKDAQFEFTVAKVEERVLPALDDEFATSFGIAEGGVEQLRKEVRDSMEREVNQASRAAVRGQLFDALYRDNPLELPQSMVDEQVAELQAQAMRNAGIQDPQQAPPRDAFLENARKRVALGLLIGEIVRAQNLKVDRARVEERLDSVAAGYPNPEEARRQLLSSREATEQLESAALEDQALDWILAQVKVTDKPRTFRELTGFGNNPE